MGRKIVVAIDSSEHSLLAARWASANLIRNGDDLHLVSICTPPPYTAIPPLATTGCATASFINYEQCRKEDELKIKQLLHDVKSEVFNNFPEQSVHLHIVPGGDVGSCITIWAKEYHADVVVLGSRGMGTLKDTLMSVVGLGSVSKHCIHNLHCAVVVIKPAPHEGAAAAQQQTEEGPKKVLVSVDDSDQATKALNWAIENVWKEGDELHLVCVALPVPYATVGNEDPETVSQDSFRAEHRGAVEHAEHAVLRATKHAIHSLKIAMEDASAAHVLESKEMDLEVESSLSYAEKTVAQLVQIATTKVPKEKVFFKALEPEGGASDVGESIKHYTESNNINVAIMGARGIGAMKRALLSAIGLGSVSDWCVQNLNVPVIIVKE